MRILHLAAIAAALTLSGCEFVTYEYYPEPAPYEEVVVVSTPAPIDPIITVIYDPYEICYDEPPFYHDAAWCDHYSYGTCCGWEVSHGPLCDEVWCYWDDRCGWEYDEFICYEPYPYY